MINPIKREKLNIHVNIFINGRMQCMVCVYVEIKYYLFLNGIINEETAIIRQNHFCHTFVVTPQNCDYY